jgi:hypothetical protein
VRRDFTTGVFESLLESLLAAGYQFVPFAEYVSGYVREERTIILRHDVDRRPSFSVRFAEVEQRFGIRGTFYFRIVPASFDERAIARTAELGHEVGYHYEDLALASGDPERAIELFERHLKKMRALCPIRSVCMHGSPFSAHDNRLLWRKFSYRDYGLVGEPYLDLDFTRVLYLTDTGRRWDGSAVSIRDKVPSSGSRMRFRNTQDIIAAAHKRTLPPHVMITTHPQRWSDSLPEWTLELVGQRIKNMAKGALNVTRRSS